MTPWCVVHVCSWRRQLADCHSLPFPWTLSLRRRWCPSASHHPLTFLFLHALTFPLPFPSLPLAFPSVGRSAHRPHTIPSLPIPLVGCANVPYWGGGGYVGIACALSFSRGRASSDTALPPESTVFAPPPPQLYLLQITSSICRPERK